MGKVRKTREVGEIKAEHESGLLTGTHELTHENTHHKPDPWIQIHS